MDETTLNQITSSRNLALLPTKRHIREPMRFRDQCSLSHCPQLLSVSSSKRKMGKANTILEKNGSLAEEHPFVCSTHSGMSQFQYSSDFLANKNTSNKNSIRFRLRGCRHFGKTYGLHL
jgi:hypothetical protein